MIAQSVSECLVGLEVTPSLPSAPSQKERHTEQIWLFFRFPHLS
jgi:hypothetical protein